MEFKKRIVHQLSNISQAYRRYPLTMLLFVVLSMMNAIQIMDEVIGYERFVHGLLVAILLTMATSHLNERFIADVNQRWVLLTGTILLSVLYYLTLPMSEAAYLVYEVRTGVIVFALSIAFVWIPSIGNKTTYFYQYFLAAFKSGFTTLLYGLVITLGLQAIVSSIDYLLFAVDYDYFLQAANIVWFIFAPSYFLSLVPPISLYDAEDRQLGKVDREAFETTRFLKILINYIVIPLLAIYTVILLAYVLLNIRGEFWADNLLEPMLISYTITVIVVYLLASNFEEPVTRYFRQLFPKILIPIVLFQSIASVLKVQEIGITHGRYYVILFGLFALIVGIIFSIFQKEKAGLIVPFLVVLAGISVVPPIDAFTVAKNSQINLLTEILEENEMLLNNQIQKNSTIHQKDQVRMTISTDYLDRMGYMDEIDFLPANFDMYVDFEDTFGFTRTYEESSPQVQENLNQYASFDRSSLEVMKITEEDYFIELYLSNYEEETNEVIIEISEDYILKTQNSLPYFEITIGSSEGEEILAIDLEPLFTQAFEATSSDNEMMATAEEMTLIIENEELKVRILALELMKNEGNAFKSINAHLYAFIDVKNE